MEQHRKKPLHVHYVDKSYNLEDSFFYNLEQKFKRDINAQHNRMNEEGSPYNLLLARLLILERAVADVHEELAELRGDVSELRDRGDEAWLGGTD